MDYSLAILVLYMILTWYVQVDNQATWPEESLSVLLSALLICLSKGEKKTQHGKVPLH